MLQKEQGGFGDSASIQLNAGASANETVGIEGFYHVECRDAHETHAAVCHVAGSSELRGAAVRKNPTRRCRQSQ